ncbi:LysR family transcriptional regulator [Mesorhizobium sp. INR15]|uniref:LysR family transcriptional regulator n=1 Tax=Mesorhizobium sp. INR15 TaxID=2654248 RepID=UPI00189687A6|nr:LysR family transcriptional regulator [Mesorhizobium sp. INR15]QPC95556.1 LysR family transcriptional regulator [Mesorhizobium sp. INR15]
MNIPLLLTFLDVMETGNFKRTAERMNIMQSTVSARIRQLEETLGVRLFERGRGGAEPTPAGRRFEGHCRSFLTMWGHARRDVLSGAAARRRRLHISCQYSLVRAYLMDWIDKLRSEEGDLDLHVEINFSSQIQRDILSGETDIGIMFAPQLTPDVQIADLGAAEFIMVSTDHEALADVEISRYIKVAYTSAFERALDEVLPEFAFPSMVIGSDDLAIELLGRHGGTLYLPRFAFAGAQSKVSGIRIVQDAPTIPQPVFSAVHMRRRRDPVVVWALKSLKQVIDHR